MTPAERLRAAAQLARETAEAATEESGPKWSTRGHLVVSEGEWQVADTSRRIATHIALWSPPIALTVAALLDATASAWDAYGDAVGDLAAALAVADALLSAAGEEAET